MIDIIHSKFDLSRRVTLYYLGGLSFRKYLEFQLKKTIPLIGVADLIKNHTNFVSDINITQILKHFRTYLKTGYYLFFNNLNQDM